MKKEIRQILEEVGYLPSEKQLCQLQLFYQLLVQKNKVMNLTALDAPEDFLEKHLRDSLLLHRHFVFKENSKLIDVGTGAGFPGLPIAIMEPTLSVALLDSLSKRIIFLEEVIDALELGNAFAVNMRAEIAGQVPEFREHFDYCVSRAVSHLNKLTEYCLPLVKPGGWFIPYKAEKVLAEIPESQKVIALLGGEYTGMKEDQVLGAKRYFPMIVKKKGTPEGYPRSSEKIAKKAL
ncbi:16S rRNA (guanine(527)-N(7))-methyltransferase RsmG [Clostridiales bacterium COT073_COT-073]|nr:16S rRNA (guanine(527)-N(7))-methyltransferase RsmG [Clostridiales bacterium COT073_COT-073]